MRRNALLVVALALVVVLAGCSGNGGTTTPTGTDAPTVTDATEGSTTNSPTATATSTSSATQGTTSSDSSSYDPTELRSAITGTIDELDAYRIDADASVVLSGPATQEISQNVSTLVDRDDREFRRNVSVERMGRTSESTAYLVEETLYLRSQGNVQQYSSEWIQLDVSSNFSRYWRTQDTLGQFRGIVENASEVAVVGTDSVDGTPTATLSIDLSGEEFQSVVGNGSRVLQGANVTVGSAQYTLEVDPQSGRILAGSSRVNSTVTIRGQTLQQNTTTTYDFEYDVSGSVTLPDAADGAFNVSEGSQGTTTESRVRVPSTDVRSAPSPIPVAADP